MVPNYQRATIPPPSHLASGSVERELRLVEQRCAATLGAGSEDLVRSEAPELSVTPSTSHHLHTGAGISEVLNEGHELEGPSRCPWIIDLDGIARPQPRPGSAAPNLRLSFYGHRSFLSREARYGCHAGAMNADATAKRSRALDAIAGAVSILADHGFVVAVLVGIDTLRHRSHLRRNVVRLATVGISVLIVNVTVKLVVNRSRPEGASAGPALVRTPTSSSFPSGHTLAATTAALALPAAPAGQISALAGATLVGWSRVRLGAHHRSDVVGGLAIGALLGTVLRRAFAGIDREWIDAARR